MLLEMKMGFRHGDETMKDDYGITNGYESLSLSLFFSFSLPL